MTINIWGKVISVQICLDSAILGPQNCWKQPKMAYFGSFCLFDTPETNFLAGTNWISLKNHWQYMSGFILSPDQVGSSHILVSKQLKTWQNDLFWQFSPIWHSVAVDQHFDWNQLDLTQKWLTIYKGRYFKSRSSLIQPYIGLNWP